MLQLLKPYIDIPWTITSNIWQAFYAILLAQKKKWEEVSPNAALIEKTDLVKNVEEPSEMTRNRSSNFKIPMV